MASVTVFGFPRSTYVKIVRLILIEKGVAYDFHDTATEMHSPEHRARHPFGRVPVLRHGDFMLYETAAIAAYVDEVFDGPRLTPEDPRQRARMNQWISNLNTYYYPWMVYHIVHERIVFPELGIPGSDAIVARAIPHVKLALEVMARELADGRPFIVGDKLTMADFFLYPTIYALSVTPEGKEMLPAVAAVQAWHARMEAVPSVAHLNRSMPPRQLLEHAREWVNSHRPAA